MKRTKLHKVVLVALALAMSSAASVYAVELDVPTVEEDTQEDAAGNSASKGRARNTNPEIVEVTDGELKEKAFRMLINEMYPTTPHEIKEIKKKGREIEEAMYNEKPATPLSGIIPVSLKPGDKSPVIKVTPGHVTALTFIDATGQPWPITNAVIGNGMEFAVDVVSVHKYKNLITVTATRNYGSTNITITLAEQSTPITLRVESTPSEYHSSPVLQLNGYGPHAEAPTFSTIQVIPDDEVLKNVVLGIGPANAVKMHTDNKGVEAWRFGDWLYIRSHYKLINPLPKDIYNGPGGYSAYKMMNMPVISMSDSRGNRYKVRVNEKADAQGGR